MDSGFRRSGGRGAYAAIALVSHLHRCLRQRYSPVASADQQPFSVRTLGRRVLCDPARPSRMPFQKLLTSAAGANRRLSHNMYVTQTVDTIWTAGQRAPRRPESPAQGTTGPLVSTQHRKDRVNGFRFNGLDAVDFGPQRVGYATRYPVSSRRLIQRRGCRMARRV